jgi:hypothetical protein
MVEAQRLVGTWRPPHKGILNETLDPHGSRCHLKNDAGALERAAIGPVLANKTPGEVKRSHGTM